MLFIKILIVWIIVGWLLTELMLRGVDKENPEHNWRGRPGYLFVLVLFWPITLGVYVKSYIEGRMDREK